MFLQHKKHKVLSKLIAFTFMLNTLTPVAFAEEVTAETNVTAEATAKENTVTTNNLNTVRTNNSGQLSLNSVQTDVLNRIAQSEAQAFKNKNLNITDEEINSLMNIPLSTTDDVEYYTQEEKDYNNLQLLIARGLNTKEKRDEALQKLQAIEELSKTDSSVGLTNTEKYVKSLLENYEDIESRAGSNSALGSAITPTDSSIIAYKTILKVAKAERQACRNDAVKNGTDPNECKLSERGQEAAQILTYLTNQQINQTTDSKKTTDATNSTASSTSTTGSNEARTCSDTTKRPAANNIYKCCPTDKPYINTSTGKCDTKTQNDSSNDDDDDDDDDLMKAMMYERIWGQFPDCSADPDACRSDRQGYPTPAGTESTIDKNKKDTKSAKIARAIYTPDFASRIGNVKLEFNEIHQPENINGTPVNIHIGEGSTEYQVKVIVNENSTAKEGETQKPLYVNLLSYNYLENGNVYQNYLRNQKVNEFIPVVYSTNKGVGGVAFKKVPRENPYPIYIEITDGTNRIYYTAYYKIYNLGTAIGEVEKTTSGDKYLVDLEPNDNEDYAFTSGTVQGKLKGTKWENDVCQLAVSGSYSSGDLNQDSYQVETDVALSQLNKSDCTKLGEKASSGNLEVTLPNTSVTMDKDGNGFAYLGDNVVNPVIKDNETGEYMTSEDFNNEYKSASTLGVGGHSVQLPMGRTSNNEQIVYDALSGDVYKLDNDNNWTVMTASEIGKELLGGQEFPEGAKPTITVNDGKVGFDVNGTVYDIDTDNMEKKLKRISGQLGGADTHSASSEYAKTIAETLLNNPATKVITGEVSIAEAIKNVGRKDNTANEENESKPISSGDIVKATTGAKVIENNKTDKT